MDTLNNRLPYCSFLRLVGIRHRRALDYTWSNMHLPLGINGRMHSALRAGEEEAVSFYNQHVAEVTTYKL
jgi:hypothetical protein